MKLFLPAAVKQQIRKELRSAGRREIGGILLGEDLGSEKFRIVELTVQRQGGTESHFVRDPRHYREEIQRFFERHGRQYTRFNYLGEWHSHPSFPTTPSAPDIHEMRALLADPEVGANFGVLLIARLRLSLFLNVNAYAFRQDASPQKVDIIPDRRVRLI
jgi:integrative and conjugative element protein (TIGR02256 family)